MKAFSRFRRWGWTLLALAVGVVCLVLGGARGQADQLWQKAVKICLECIGIG